MSRRRPNPQPFAPAAARLIRGIRMGLGVAQSVSVASLVIGAASKYGVDPELAMSVAQRESGLNPNLVNSKSGAAGVMQLMPATARALGVTNVFDPAQNVDAGVRYLSQMLQQFGGDSAKAVAAYDWGPGNLSSAIAEYGADWLSHAPLETRNYVAAVTGVQPGPTGQSPASPAVPPVTIDASTGEVIPNAPDVENMPTINDSGMITSPEASSPTGMYLALGALGVGLWMLGDVIRDW